jgi:hypothetical protein
VRTVAVDWSGSVSARGRTTWTAEVAGGELVFLECGRTATALAELLIGWAERDPEMVVGLDFAFSTPLWFLRERGYATAHDLWRDAAVNADEWLRACAPPFWGRPQRKRPELTDGVSWYRATEALVPVVAGTRPKSVFQVGGAGAVGTGSLRGMALLATLHDAGFSVWPFDPPHLPRVVEIYPRALTGAVRKSDAAARRAYLDARDWPRNLSLRELASSTEDAFDAAVSALVMCEHADDLRRLGDPSDPVARLEGEIWLPPGARRPQERGVAGRLHG